MTNLSTNLRQGDFIGIFPADAKAIFERLGVTPEEVNKAMEK